MVSILVVEDDIKLNRFFCTVLARNGFRTVPALDGEEALEVLDREVVDLMITDITMPGVDGYELVSSLREAGFEMPMLIITARDSYMDKELGFNAGADDYMVKPVDVNELLLRIKAILRRAQIASERRISCGDTVLSYDALTISFLGREILLPQKEFQLIYKLISHPNKIFTRQQLMDEIWGMDSESDERTVDVHINRLRDRMKDCVDLEIITVRGLGYKAVKKP